MKSQFEQYIEHLDNMVGQSARYYRVTDDEESHPIWVVIYADTPQQESLTAFTFGLSSSNFAEWVKGRPELVISVETNSIDWGLSIGYLVKQFRNSCPFSLGNVIRFGDKISKESEMSAFLIFFPTILEREQSRVHLSDRTINIVQAYPIHEGEIAIVEKLGAEQFFMQESIDFENIGRPNSGD